jgi:hypothetical protein
MRIGNVKNTITGFSRVEKNVWLKPFLLSSFIPALKSRATVLKSWGHNITSLPVAKYCLIFSIAHSSIASFFRMRIGM